MGALCSELNQLGHAVRLLVRREAKAVAIAVGAPGECVLEHEGIQARASFERTLAEFCPSDVVVDTFPEHVHTSVWRDWPKVRRVVLLRYRRDARLEHFSSALSAYDVIYDLEPALKWAPLSARPFGAVVRRLAMPALDSARPERVLLVGSEARHVDFLGRLAARLGQRGIEVAHSALPGVSRYAAPLMTSETLNARVVVGPAGYNLTYELLRSRVWHLALPVAREYDDQRLRGQRLASVVNSPGAAERKILAWLEQPGLRPTGSVRSMCELARELAGPSATHERTSTDHLWP